MSNEIEMKRLADVESVETVSDEASVLIVQDGEVKQTAKSNVGGAGGGLCLDIDFDAEICNTPTQDIVDAYNAGQIITAVHDGVVYYLYYLSIRSSDGGFNGASMYSFIADSNSLGVGYLSIGPDGTISYGGYGEAALESGK